MNTFLKQSLSGLWKGILNVNGPPSFEEISGHQDIKEIFTNAIISKRPVHLLLLGKPGSAKTMFLTEIMRMYKESYFVVGSNTTKAGLINELFERRPKFLLIDELEKMSVTDQTSLLHLMETGIISETKVNKTRQMELKSWVFATGNSYARLTEPLVSRFLILTIPEYTFEEFIEISSRRLRKENVNECTARLIAQKVWHELDSRDIRDVIKVARLANDSQRALSVINILKRQKKAARGLSSYLR